MPEPTTGKRWLKITFYGGKWIVFDKDKEPSLFHIGRPVCVLFEADSSKECHAWIAAARAKEREESTPCPK